MRLQQTLQTLRNHFKLPGCHAFAAWPACRCPDAGDGRRKHATLHVEKLEDRAVPTILFGIGGDETTTDLGGPVINNVHVELIFWGANWTTLGNQAFAGQIQSAVDNILASHYVGRLALYRNSIGQGFRADTFTITDSSPGSIFSIVDVDNLLQSELANGNIPNEPANDPIYLYFVVPQPGSISVESLGAHSFDTFNDTDDNLSSTFYYAWTPDDGTLDTVSSSLSHQLVDSITDPEGTAIQVNPTNPNSWNEIADNGASVFLYRLSGIQVQSYWSTADDFFVVPDGNFQSFFVGLFGFGELNVFGDQFGAGENDFIAISATASGGVIVDLNGEFASFDPGQISGIDVDTGTGLDTVTVAAIPGVPMTINSLGIDTVNVGTGNLDLLTGAITVAGTGSTEIILNDDQSPSSNTYTITGTSVGRPNFAGLTYVNVAGLTLNTETGNVTANINNTTVPIIINEGNGNDTVNIEHTTSRRAG